MNDYAYNYAIEKAKERISILYSDFWLWSKANGYEIALGDMKKAWEKFQEDELMERHKTLFTGSYECEIKEEFNAYCAERIKQEREIIKKENKL